MAIQYIKPNKWIVYTINEELFRHLTDAKAAVLSLVNMPLQRSWAEHMQAIQLKREVAGTSRIEGADFTERELDEAMKESPEKLVTRSQKQAAAAVKAYRWIASLDSEKQLGKNVIFEIHRLVVTDADDDHCSPGQLRKQGQNVTFGTPRHRGVEGGDECERVFNDICQALHSEFSQYDPLIQALALHYHFAAMHPFLDGNGRTARALEAFMLQKVGLRDVLFIAMSNYYYDEKNAYLNVLAKVRAQNNDLTPFLLFGLKGIKLQCGRLLSEIKVNVSKSLYRNVMYDLFKRLRTPRKRAIKFRQITILKLLLEKDRTYEELLISTQNEYKSLKNSVKALTRDINYLLQLGAISYTKIGTDVNKWNFFIRLEWPTEITEQEFYKRMKTMPKSKTSGFL
jgi:Fic family protein